jgi:hypothetical protein
MKPTTIALVAALALSSTAALAQTLEQLTPPGSAYGNSGPGIVGTVTAPSVGTYSWPLGMTNVAPTWNNTMPPARTAPVFPDVPTVGIAPFRRGVRR